MTFFVSLLILSSGIAKLHAQGKYELALQYASKHNFDLAIQQLHLQIAEDSSFTEAYIRLADFYRYGDQLPRAQLFFRQAIAGNPQNANPYLGQATVAKHLGNLEGALQSATTALEKGSTAYQAVQLLVDSAIQLRKTDRLPRTLSRFRRSPTQKDLYDLGYAIWRLRIRNLRRARSTISSYLIESPNYFGHRLAGEISLASAQPGNTISRFKKALDLTEPAYKFYDLTILSSLASTYLEVGRIDSADYFFRHALDGSRAIGALAEELDISLSYLELMEKQKRYYEWSELSRKGGELAKKLTDLAALQEFNFRLARASQSMGDSDRAFHYFRLCTQAEDSLASAELTAAALLQMARLRMAERSTQAASEYLTKCLEYATKNNLENIRYQCLLSIADLHKSRGDAQSAKTTYEQVLRYAQRTRQYELVEICFTRLSHMYLKPPSNLQRAQYYLSLADALARQTLQPQFAATNRWMQGKIALLQGEIERAETFFLDAIQLGTDAGVYSAVLAGNAGLIRTYSTAGFGDLANARIDTTFSYLERHGQLCFDQYLDEYWDLYEDLSGPAIETLSKRGNLSTIFDAFEKHKALQHQKSVFQLKYRQDALGLNSTQRPVGLDEDLIREKWKSIWELWKGERGDNSSEVQNIRDEIRQAFGSRKEKRLSVAGDPLLASLETPLTESIYTLREKLQTTGDVFLHYLVGDKSINILLVRPDSVFLKNVDVGKQELFTWVRQISPADAQLDESSTNHTLPAFRVDTADTLYRLIFEPVSNWIPEESNLVISPDDVLSTLPFECLVSNSSESTDNYDYRNVRFLVEDFNISYAPYASFLCWPPRTAKRNGERIGVFSKKPVDGGDDLRDRLGSRSIGLNEGENCTKDRFLSEAGRYQVLHLDTPAILNGTAPLYSSVTFNDSGGESSDLRTFELFEQKHHAELAVLTSISWRPNPASTETGIGGLVHAWNYSGVPSIVINAWDAPTKSSHVIANFYSNLKQGLDKAEALRQAKVAFMNEEDRDPRLWGGYLLYGDTRTITFRTENLAWVITITILGSLTLIVVLIRQSVRIRKERLANVQAEDGS